MNNGRDGTLQAIYSAFKRTGIHLLSLHDGKYFPSGPPDDSGYFLYVSILSSFFGLEPLVTAALFFKFFTVITLVVLFIGFYCMFPRRISIFLISLFLGRLMMPLVSLNKVYFANFFASMFIPLVLLVEKKKNLNWFYKLSIVAGMATSFFDTIRLFSSLPLIVFSVLHIIFSKVFTYKQKMRACMLFFLFYQIPSLHFMYEFNRRNAFLKKQGIEIPNLGTAHLFWHNIYTGLGYLNNSEGITWNDSCAAEAALKINPEAKYPSKLYEQTIRSEILRLCKEKRYFVITTLFAKLGVIFYYFLTYFGWVGFLCSYLYPKPWYIECAFWAALAVSALPGILTIPITAYLIGFITCTMVYALYSLLWAIHQRRGSNVTY